jgi:hypothetical protein
VSVTDEQKKTLDPDLDLGWDLDDDDTSESARPTLAPPFDLDAYAKEAMVPSAENRAAPPAEPALPAEPADATKAGAIVPNRVISLPPPPPLPTRSNAGRPAGGAVPRSQTDSTGPTNRTTPLATQAPITQPPPPGREGMAALSAVITPVPPSSSPPSQRITPREMQRLEAAVALSKRDSAREMPAVDSAAGPPRADSVLQMANQRAPLLTPPRMAAVPSPVPTAAREATAPAAEAADPVIEMQERFALGDYSGALVMAESMLEENPTHVEAREYAESCRSVLQQMYTARIGPLDRVPVVDIARDQLRWLSIDHRTGFILSLVDGVSSLEMILDVCGMPPLDALRMLFELVQQRIISIRDD